MSIEVKKSKRGIRIQDTEKNIEVLLEFKYGYKEYLRVKKNSILRSQNKIPASQLFNPNDLFTKVQELSKTHVVAKVGFIGGTDSNKELLAESTAVCSEEDRPTKAVGRYVALAKMGSKLKLNPHSKFISNDEQARELANIINEGLGKSGIKIYPPTLSNSEKSQIVWNWVNQFYDLPEELQHRILVVMGLSYDDEVSNESD